MSWTTICKITDIPHNAGVAALVNGQQIAIFSIAGELYAIDNFDPISKANVLSRGIIGSIQGDLCVAAPLYKQHFSLTSGQCLEEEEYSVNTYPVRLKGDTVEIDGSAITVAA